MVRMKAVATASPPMLAGGERFLHAAIHLDRLRRRGMRRPSIADPFSYLPPSHLPIDPSPCRPADPAIWLPAPIWSPTHCPPLCSRHSATITRRPSKTWPRPRRPSTGWRVPSRTGSSPTSCTTAWRCPRISAATSCPTTRSWARCAYGADPNPNPNPDSNPNPNLNPNPNQGAPTAAARQARWVQAVGVRLPDGHAQGRLPAAAAAHRLLLPPVHADDLLRGELRARGAAGASMRLHTCTCTCMRTHAHMASAAT